MKVKTISILGSSGFVGSNIKQYLLEQDFNVISVSSQKSDKNIFWDYKCAPPKEIFQCDLIIDCARSINPFENIRKTKMIVKNMPSKCKYLFFSSGAIFKKPRNSFLFRGDDYIREKKILTHFLKRNAQVQIIYPDIILGAGGVWNKTINEVANSTEAYLPDQGKIDTYIISIQDLANQILRAIDDGTILQRKFLVCHKKTQWNKIIIKENIKKLRNTNIYFNNPIKNLFTQIINSSIIPDYLNFSLMNMLRKKSLNKDVCIQDIYTPSAMTRFYFSNLDES